MTKIPEYNLRIKKIRIKNTVLENEFPIEKTVSNQTEANKWMIKQKEKRLIAEAKKKYGEEGYKRRLMDNFKSRS